MYLDFFADLLFPPACLGCNKNIPSGSLCGQCEATIELFQTLFCGKCGARLPGSKKICHLDFPYLLGTATRYHDFPVHNLITGLKFKGIQSAALPLAMLLIQYFSGLNINMQNFYVVPIPLSNKREQGRGFNQSALIARHFAEHFNLIVQEDILARNVHTKPQSETDDIFERRKNILGCFSVKNIRFLQNKNIILIDDVSTSGTTFFEAAQALRSAGTKRIIALAVAQA